jgi:hypothetical protein
MPDWRRRSKAPGADAKRARIDPAAAASAAVEERGMVSIDRLAEMAIARACGFAGLGVVAVMAGLAFDPLLSVKAGAILISMVTAVLHFFAIRAPAVPYKRTEVWLMIDAPDRPPAGIAQRLIGNARRTAYRRFALFAAVAATALWLVALTLVLFG